MNKIIFASLFTLISLPVLADPAWQTIYTYTTWPGDYVNGTKSVAVDKNTYRKDANGNVHADLMLNYGASIPCSSGNCKSGISFESYNFFCGTGQIQPSSADPLVGEAEKILCR